MEYIEETYPNNYNITEDEVVVVGSFHLTPNEDGIVELNGIYRDNNVYAVLDAESSPFIINEEKNVIIYNMDEFTKLVLSKIKEAI